MEKDLSRDLTDWEQIYLDIQLAGISDPGFHLENFGQQTIALIEKTCTAIQSKMMVDANGYNYSCAYVCALYFGGEIKKYLPYDVDKIESKKKDDPKKVTKETAIAFRQANKEGLIPMHIIGAFSPYMDDIMVLTK